MNHMYIYTQDFLKNKQSTDVFKRKVKVVAVSSDRSSFPIGAIVTVNGKESQDTWRGVNNKGKSGYLENTDFEFIPLTKDEFEITRKDLVDEADELGRKISYFEETKSEEFDAADFAAWTVVKALKDQKDDDTIRKEIVKVIMSFSTVTS